MNTLDSIGLARSLVELKARISIIHKETGLSATYLRKVFNEIHHEPPLCGQMKSSPNSLFKSYCSIKQASLYVLFYRAESRLDIGIWCIIHAYRRYLAYCQMLGEKSVLLDFSSAYQVAKWVDGKMIQLVKCGHCRSVKMILQGRSINICAVCKQA